MTVGTSSVGPSVLSHKVWQPARKTADEASAVKAVYELFASKHDIQLEKFRKILDSIPKDIKDSWRSQLNSLGLDVDYDTCHVKYMDTFQPIESDYDLCYVRHGKTEGNTEPRIFQGFCDYWENQLNETGKQQAIDAAKKMESMLQSGDFVPDLIILSPLGRAIETGEAFFAKHPEIPTRVNHEAREQQFGCWDNMQLRFMSPEDICHLFYLDQNALVKAPAPHISSNGQSYDSENFVDLIIREAKFLKSLNSEAEVSKAKKEGRRAKVLIYGHSMAGAAISALLGHGKKFDDKGSIGFDGKYIMPNATPTLLLPKKPE